MAKIFGRTHRCAPTAKGNKTKEQKDKKTNNILLLFEKRTARSHSAVCDDGTFMFPKECIWLTACGGGDEKTQAKKVKLPPPAGTPSLLQKRGRV